MLDRSMSALAVLAGAALRFMENQQYLALYRSVVTEYEHGTTVFLIPWRLNRAIFILVRDEAFCYALNQRGSERRLNDITLPEISFADTANPDDNQ